jgi:hypothetical protein
MAESVEASKEKRPVERSLEDVLIGIVAVGGLIAGLIYFILLDVAGV